MALVNGDLERGTITPLLAGNMRARLAVARDLPRAQALRYRCFIENTGAAPRPGGVDRDRFDTLCDHILIEDEAGYLLCTFRVMPLGRGLVGQGYSAQYYDLTKLENWPGTILELGRFCVAPGKNSAHILRLAWAMLARLVDFHEASLLIGCSSFSGTDQTPYRDAFALMHRSHLAPAKWAPAPRFTHFVPLTPAAKFSAIEALRQLPPLLKSYLNMGGWVSDHAVIDLDLNTVHIFTGLEIAAIPKARARALRQMADIPAL